MNGGKRRTAVRLAASALALSALGGCATGGLVERTTPAEEELLGVDDMPAQGTMSGEASSPAGGRADEPELLALDEFGMTDYSDAWRADRLLGLEVRGIDGRQIGEVENIVVGADGTVDSLIVEVGGFLDIGDTHLKIPWEEVTVDPSGELRYAVVPLEEGEESRYSPFDGSGAAGGDRTFRITELIGDYVTLEGSSDYALVDDLVFDEEGTLKAVVVSRNAALGGGYYAYPYYGYDYGFDPGLGTYDLPYAADDLTGLDPFDYRTLGGYGAF